MTPGRIVEWLVRYILKFELALTWSPPGQKGPRHVGWNVEANAIRTPAAARRFWTIHPDYGAGVLLQFSGLASFDVDDVSNTRIILRHFGINLDELAACTPCIIGNPAKFRLMFRAPATPLTHRTLMWPQKDDPRKGFCVFELRAGPISDALPPTIHPGTKQPYRWANPPRDGFPPLPATLLQLWLDWPQTEHAARAMCPWAPAPAPERPRPARARTDAGPSVIDTFNAAHDVVAILEQHGYTRRGKRFAKAQTSHAPGLVLLEGGKIWCHHAGDPLGGGRARDAFDVWATLEHNGNVHAAVKAAAQLLGMQQERGMHGR